MNETPTLEDLQARMDQISAAVTAMIEQQSAGAVEKIRQMLQAKKNPSEDFLRDANDVVTAVEQGSLEPVSLKLPYMIDIKESQAA